MIPRWFRAAPTSQHDPRDPGAGDSQAQMQGSRGFRVKGLGYRASGFIGFSV